MTARRRSTAGRLAHAADRIRTSLWIWPALAGLAGAVAAELLVRLDRSLDEGDTPSRLAFGGDADAAQAVLSTIAGASMTVLGVTISLTLAVLALAAQGYTPRVLTRFMRDRGVQAVVASLIGTFTFSLGALRLVREDQVPGITVNVAVLAALASLGILIGFFHHLASEIRVERVIAGAWADSLPAIRQLAALGDEPDRAVVPAPPVADVRADRTGRVVWVDEGALVDVARACGSVVSVDAPVGGFVCEGEVVARCHGGRPPRDAERVALAGAVRIGTQRTHAGDFSFGLRQITDIALRALSPGVNDSTTAHEAILRAADLLRRLADRELGMRMRDSDGNLRVVRDRPDWDDLVGLCIDQLAAGAEAQADAATMVVLLDALTRVAAATNDPGRLAVLRDRARRLRDGAERSLEEPRERARVEDAARALT